MKKFALICVALIALLTSCEHKELCFHHPHNALVRVMFNFENIDKMPEGMRVAFYPKSGGEPEIYDFIKGESRIIEIPENYYDAVCYNFDTHDIKFLDSRNFTTFTATSYDAPRTDELTMLHTPDWLCGQPLTDIDITDLQPGEERIIVFTPQPMVCDYTFEVNGIRGLERVADIKASLSGLGGSLALSYDTVPQDNIVGLLFGASINDDQVTGAFHTFSPIINAPHNFSLYIKTAKGSYSTVAAEVSEQILAVPLKGHIHRVHLIINLDCDVPDDPPESGGAGFDPGTEDWQDINKDIFV